MAERLWDKFEIVKEDEVGMEWIYGTSRESTTESEVCDAEHVFLKPKRKNSKETKSIYGLTHKQIEQKGIAFEPVPMEIDVEATEAELEAQLMDEAAVERVSEGRFPQGRRLTGRRNVNPSAAQKKSLWR